MFPQLLQVRDDVIALYKRFELYIVFFARFIIGLIVFGFINNIGHALPLFHAMTSAPLKLPFLVLMGLLFAILPLNVSYVVMSLNIVIQLSSYTEIAFLAAVFLICVLFFYARLAPKESVLILLTVAAYYFKIPYAIPLAAGLYGSLLCVIPIGIGVTIWYAMPVLASLMQNTASAGLDVMSMPDVFKGIAAQFSLHSQSLAQEAVLTVFVFAMAFVVVYAITRFSVNYARQVALAAGSTFILFGFIIVGMVAHVSFGYIGLIFSLFFSALLVCVIQFFDVALDYDNAESVQFEDEDHYYYVKIIPKISAAVTAAAPAAKAKRPARSVNAPRPKRPLPPRPYDGEDRRAPRNGYLRYTSAYEADDDGDSVYTEEYTNRYTDNYPEDYPTSTRRMAEDDYGDMQNNRYLYGYYDEDNTEE